MITKLYVAANQIPSTGWGHLQIVAYDSFGTGSWFETEVQYNAPGFDWRVNNSGSRLHNDSTNTPGYGDAQSYARTEIDLNYEIPDSLEHAIVERSASDVWELILQASEGILSQYLPYAFLSNSNSYANTLLKAVGISLPDIIGTITPPEVTWDFPGWQTDVSGPPNSVEFHIRGTDGNDVFFGGWGDDQIRGGLGDDYLGDGLGKDVVEGGEGDNQIILSSDNRQDIIVVGQGNDKISGGDADDRLVVRLDQILDRDDSLLSEIQTIPLLGGFYLEQDDPNVKKYYYANYLEQFVFRPPPPGYGEFNPDFPWIMTTTEKVLEDVYWNDLLITYEDRGEPYYALPFGFLYELEGSTLTITISRGWRSEDGEPQGEVMGTVTIEDFTSGQYGINFYEDYYINEYYLDYIPYNYDYGPQYYAGEGYGLNQINNNGEYILIPNLDEMTPGVRMDESGPIPGTSGNDTIHGTLDDDIILPGAGDDTVLADAGVDTVSYSDATASVSVNLQAGAASGADIGSDDLTDVENATGGAGDDTLVGSAGANRIDGGNGDDTLQGGASRDELIGGDGSDTYVYQSGDGSDVVDDRTSSSTDVDTLQFADLSLTDITISRDDDNLVLTIAGTGDVITVKHQFDANATGLGIEKIVFDDSSFLDASGIEAATRVQIGTTGDDSLVGTGGSDSLSGGDGYDFLDGKSGADLLAGGAGDDTYMIDRADDTVSENANEGIDTVLSAATDYTLPVDVENLVLLPEALNGTGNGANNTITGNERSNVLVGLGGADTFHGNGGSDTVSYEASSAAVTIDLEEGTATGGDATGDTFDSIENIVGTAYSDNLKGGYGGNILRGLGGDDILEGGGGSDTLDGGAGADTLTGGEGNDTYVVDDVNDVLVETNPTGIDTVMSSITFSLDTYFENLTLTGNAAINGTGNDVANILVGNEGDNTLTGGLGDDILNGGSGADTLIGGDGDDRVVIDADDVYWEGGVGYDTLVYSGSEDFTYTLPTGGFEAVESGGGNDSLYGDSQDNILNGGAGDDLIQASTGNDEMIGGEGYDQLSGGAGDDTYIYNVGDGTDSIIEASGEGTNDTLVLNGFAPSDLTFARRWDDLDIVVSAYVNPTDVGTVTIVNAFSLQPGTGIEKVVFSDNTIWDRDDLLAAVGYVYKMYDQDINTVGSALVLDRTFTLAEDADITESTLVPHTTIFATTSGGQEYYAFTVSAGERGIFDIDGASFDTVIDIYDANGTWIAANDDSIEDAGSTLQNSYLDYTFVDGGTYYIRLSSWDENGVGSIPDGADYSLHISLQGADTGIFDQILVGTSGDDILTGTAGADMIRGNGGNDTLHGNGGDDTYIYQLGSGNDLIQENGLNTDIDTLRFIGLNASDLTFSRSIDDNSDVVITTNATGEQITIDDQTDGLASGIEKFDFADGSTWDTATISVYSRNFIGTVDAEIINGTAGDDTIRGNGGDDTLHGNGGDDTYVYQLGSGNDVIQENGLSTDVDTFRFVGLNASDLTFSRSIDDNSDVVITTNATGEQITIDDQTDGLASGIEMIEFADGSTWDTATISVNSRNFIGTVDAEIINGTAGDDTIRGNGGDDTLHGNGGDDTYVYQLGSGNDLIQEKGLSTDVDTLRFVGLNASDLTFSRSISDNDDVVITTNATGEQITIDDQALGSASGIEYVQFADGSTWDAATLLANSQAFMRTAGIQTLSSFSGSGNRALSDPENEAPQRFGSNEALSSQVNSLRDRLARGFSNGKETGANLPDIPRIVGGGADDFLLYRRVMAMRQDLSVFGVSRGELTDRMYPEESRSPMQSFAAAS